MSGPQASILADGRRLHLNHGPIDLIIDAFGSETERLAGLSQATRRFRTVLEELVRELPALRKPVDPAPGAYQGSVAARMGQATGRHADIFITPMAAVAGSVADEILAALVCGRQIEKAYVNNGGDIAIHLTEGASMRIAIAGTDHGLDDRMTIKAADRVRGIATSGWRGRSFSLGIADAVTVLARTAAGADAAATVIANAVDLPGHRAIVRQRASVLSPDSDLGDRLVTTDVGPLSAAETAEALERGRAVADDCLRRGLIEGAALFLRGQARACFDGSTQSGAALRALPDTGGRNGAQDAGMERRPANSKREVQDA